MEIKIYKNYGCLGAEKENVYTYGSKAESAVCSDEIEVILPEGWSVVEGMTGSTLFESPWKETYLPKDILCGNDHPYFIAIDNDGNEVKVRLKEVK